MVEKDGIGAPSMLRIGVIGYGYWGPNIVRNFSTWTAPPSWPSATQGDTLRKVEKNYPGMRATKNYDELIRRRTSMPWPSSRPSSPTTSWPRRPSRRQARFCREALHLHRRPGRRTHQAGRAQRSSRSWWTTPSSSPGAVRKIKQLVDDGTLGKILLLRLHAGQPRASSSTT